MLSQKSSQQKAYFALAWVSIFWGTTWLASRVGVQHMPALQMIGLRQFIAGVLFVLFFMLKKRPLPKGRQWISILVLSVLNFMISNGFVIWGVKYISSGLGAIIGAIFPLWLVIIVMFNGNKLPTKAIAGMIIGFTGVCIIFYDHLKDFLNAGFRFGIFLSLTASVTWAFAALYTQKHKNTFNPYYSLGIQMIISGAVFLGCARASGDVISVMHIPAASWWAIIYLVIVGSALTFVAYVYALQHLPASLASVYAYINPIVAFILGAVFLDEKINLFIIIGGLITILGVFLVNSSLRAKSRGSEIK